MRKISMPTAVLLAVVVGVHPLAAQSTERSPFPWRTIAFPLVGGAVIGTAASFAGERGDGSLCDSKTCITSMGAAIGIGLGLFIGQEMDGKRKQRFLEGPTLDPMRLTVVLPDQPIGLYDFPGGVLTLSSNGVGVLGDDLEFRSAATGVQTRAGIVVPAFDLVLLATNTALFGLSLDGADEPLLLWNQGAGSLALLRDGSVLVGEVGRIRRASLSGGRGDWTLLEETTAATRGLPVSLVAQERSDVVWTAADSFVVAHDTRTLREMGRVQLPGRVQSLRVDGSSGVAALGAHGAVLLDLGNARTPSVAGEMGGMTSAYAGAILDRRVYVAAGSQGVFVFEMDDSAPPRPLGVVRGFDLVTDVVVHGGRIHVLDRGKRSITRLERDWDLP